MFKAKLDLTANKAITIVGVFKFLFLRYCFIDKAEK